MSATKYIQIETKRKRNFLQNHAGLSESFDPFLKPDSPNFKRKAFTLEGKGFTLKPHGLTLEHHPLNIEREAFTLEQISCSLKP